MAARGARLGGDISAARLPRTQSVMGNRSLHRAAVGPARLDTRFLRDGNSGPGRHLAPPRLLRRPAPGNWRTGRNGRGVAAGRASGEARGGSTGHAGGTTSPASGPEVGGESRVSPDGRAAPGGTAMVKLLGRAKHEHDADSGEDTDRRVDPGERTPENARPGMSETEAARTAGNEGPGEDPRGRHAESPTQIPKRGWKDILVRSYREFKADNISMVAAAAAFYAWLALLPAVLSAIMLYGLFADPDQVSRQFEQLTKNLSEDVRNTLAQPVEQATSGAGGGLTIGVIIAIAGAVWSASGGMNGLIQGIGIAYDEGDDRNFVKKRGLAI